MRAVLLRNCNAREDAKFWLQYMPMRNRAEVPRIMLEYSEVPYAFEVIGYRQWAPDAKAATEFGKTPTLVDVEEGEGGLNISHEMAITRYLADKLGLSGKNSSQRARADELYCQYWHTIRNNGLTHAGSLYNAKALIDDSALGDIPKFKETHRVNDLSAGARSIQALRVFEEILGQEAGSGNSFLVGNSMTYVDLALFDTLSDLAELDNVPDFGSKFDLPNCQSFLEKISSIPSVSKYLESPSRVPRYERPSYTYIPDMHSQAS